MKIFHRARVAPINLAPGDVLQVTYSEPGKPDRVVTHSQLDRAITVDDITMADLEAKELAELDLNDGIAVVLGNRGPTA